MWHRATRTQRPRGIAPQWAVLFVVIGVGVLPQAASAHDNVVVHRKLGEWSVTSLNNPFFFPNAADVREGCYGEDVPATRSLGHFYNPETNSAPWFALGSGPAWQNSQDQYDAAINEYLAANYSGEDAAFYRMGRALHFIQDMTSPAHTHDDQHGTDGEDFEDWGPGNVNNFDFSAVTPKFAADRTAEGFVKELSRKVYDITSYQADIDENTGAQVSSEFKTMFPSLHWVDGGFFGDDVWEVDRIGSFDCFGNGTLCNDGWWMTDERKTEDSSGRGGSRRIRGYAYIENTGGSGGDPIPTVFKGVPNTTNETLLHIYGRLLYPEAVAYGAGLLRVFAEAVGAPPTATSTPTITNTGTRTSTPTSTATHTNTATPSNTPTPVPATATPSETPQPTTTATDTATSTPTSTGTETATRTPSRTRTSTRTITPTPTPTPPTPTRTATATNSQTPSPTQTRPTETPTETATPAPLCNAVPRDCVPSQDQASIFGLFDEDDNRRDSLTWKWSRGRVSPDDLGVPIIDTRYALCVYDEVDGNPELRISMEIPAASRCESAPCWEWSPRGYKYSDRAATAAGLTSLLMRVSDDPNRGKILLKAKGLALPMPTPHSSTQLLSQSSRVHVQLVNSLGMCWGAEFSAPASRHDARKFKDSSD